MSAGPGGRASPGGTAPALARGGPLARAARVRILLAVSRLGQGPGPRGRARARGGAR